MKKNLIIVIVLIVIVAILELVLRSSAPKDTNTISIGEILPMTGIAADYGEDQSKAIQMAVDEINAKGGVLGRKLALSLQDDATDPKKDVSAYQQLTDIEHVPVIIGADWDINANAIMSLLSDKKVAVMSPTASPDILDKTNEYFFSTIPPISVHQSTVEKYLKNEPGKKVAIVYVEGGWGIAHRNTYRAAITATGKTLVNETDLPNFDGNDIQRAVTLLKSYRPDILLVAVNSEDGKNLVNKNVQLGLNAHIFAHYDLGVTFENAKADTTNLKGIVIYKIIEPTSTFMQKYKQLYNKVPGSDADKAYDAVYLIAKAIDLSKDASAAGILKGLKMISDFQGVSGPVDYTKANWPTADTAYMQIFDGKSFVPYLNN